jgi:hypothetical protein
MRVFGHVLLVVILYETVAKRRQVKREGDQAQGQADQAFVPQIAKVFFHAVVMMQNRPANSIANHFWNGSIPFSPHCSILANRTLQLFASDTACFLLSKPILEWAHYFKKAALAENGSKAKAFSHKVRLVVGKRNVTPALCGITGAFLPFKRNRFVGNSWMIILALTPPAAYQCMKN